MGEEKNGKWWRGKERKGKKKGRTILFSISTSPLSSPFL